MLNPYAGTALSVRYDPDNRDAKQIYTPSWHPTASNKPICAGGEEAVDALMDTCVDLAEIFTPPEGEELEKIIETAKALFEYAAPADKPISARGPPLLSPVSSRCSNGNRKRRRRPPLLR